MAYFMACFFLLLSTLMYAENLNFKFFGFLQTHYSMQKGNTMDEDDTDFNTHNGFGVRRVRLITRGNVLENVKFQIQFAFDKQGVYLWDAFMDYLVNEKFNIRVGKFIGVSTKNGGLVSSAALDFAWRPAGVIYWDSKMGHHGYRDLGIMAYGKLSNKLSYKLSFTNGGGADNTLANITSDYTTSGNKGFSVGGMLESKLTKCLGVGAYAIKSNKYESHHFDGMGYGAYIKFDNKKVSINAEYLGWTGDLLHNPYASHVTKTDDNAIGYTLTGTYYLTPKIQLAARYDVFDPEENNGESDYNEQDITLGVNYHFVEYNNKKAKIQFNYIIQKENGLTEEPDNNAFVVCFQVLF